MPGNSASNFLSNFLQVVLVFVPIFYSVILHYKFGQTYGKWVTGVKVIDATEIQKINLKQSIFRDIFYIVVAIIGVCYFILQCPQGFFIISDDSVYTMPFFLWNLLEVFVMFINPKRRTIHDYLANSVVVRTGII